MKISHCIILSNLCTTFFIVFQTFMVLHTNYGFCRSHTFVHTGIVITWVGSFVLLLIIRHKANQQFDSDA